MATARQLKAAIRSLRSTVDGWLRWTWLECSTELEAGRGKLRTGLTNAALQRFHSWDSMDGNWEVG